MTEHALLAYQNPSDGSQLFTQVLPWLIVLMVGVIVGGVAIMLVRRQFNSGSRKPAGGFTLQDLRDLHARGELTDEEFQRAKTLMIGRMQSAGSGTNPQPSPGNLDLRKDDS